MQEYKKIIEQAKKNAIVVDAFIEQITTTAIDGTTTVKFSIFPDIEAEKKLFELKKCHVKMVVVQQSKPQEKEGKQKPKKKTKKDMWRYE